MTVLDRPPVQTHRAAPGTAWKVLLACGVVYGLVYNVVNDVIAASLYDGYNRMDQAISELSAIGASTKPFLTAMLPVTCALLAAFGVGVWRTACGSRALRVAGGLLITSAVTGLLWLPFPMTARADMVGGSWPANDIGHLAMSGVTAVFVLTTIGFGAAGLRGWFLVYSVVTGAVVVLFGVLTSVLSPDLSSGDPTPWMGLVERVSLWAWQLWLAVFAICLWRSRNAGTRRETPPIR